MTQLPVNLVYNLSFPKRRYKLVERDALCCENVSKDSLHSTAMCRGVVGTKLYGAEYRERTSLRLYRKYVYAQYFLE